MAEQAVTLNVDDRGVGWLRLNRPQIHNAFDEALIARLTDCLREVGGRPDVRAVALAAEGRSFSAGADLEWMRRLGGASLEDNVADALKLAEMLDVLNTLPKPTLAVVQGPAFGGGVGLVACCDIAIAAETARFAMTEVRLGLIPAVISPHVLAAIGARASRRYFITGEAFDAFEALRLGLVHRVVPGAELQAAADAMLATLAQNSLEAMADAKALIRDVDGRPLDADLRRTTAERIARARASDDGRARIAAFLEKRGERR